MESTLTIKKYKVDDRRKNILNWDIMGVQYGWKREEKIEVNYISPILLHWNCAWYMRYMKQTAMRQYFNNENSEVVFRYAAEVNLYSKIQLKTTRDLSVYRKQNKCC